MRYEIEYFDDLYCVYRCERVGKRIVCACKTRAEAEERVRRYKLNAKEGR